MTDQEKQEALAAIEADRQANPQAYAPEDDGRFNWEDIGAGGYSALNSALFGIPDILVKAASSDAYKELQALRSRNRASSTIGDIAGAFAPTGGLLAKGVGTAAKLGARGLEAARLAKAAGVVGKVAKGADTAADIIRGSKAVKGLGGAVGRGALAATEAALPRLVTGQTDLEDVAKNVALGGAVGGAAYGLGKAVQRIPELFDKAQTWANKTILKRADITNRVMKAQSEYMGGDVKKYLKELADLSEELELHREPELDKMVEGVKDTWREMGSKFDASDFKIDPQKVIDAEDVAQAIKRDVNVMQNVDDIVTKTGVTDGFGNKRKYLQEIIFSDKSSEDQKKIARAVLTQIENEAERLSGLDIGKAKEQWRLMKPFEMADKLDDMRVSGAGVVKGSDTAFKLALGGMGAVAGGGSQIKGVMDDPTNPEAWSKLVTATVGGSLAGIANKQLGIALAKAIRKLPADKIEKMATDIANGKLVQVISKLNIESPSVATGKFLGTMLDEKPEETLKTPEGAEPVSPESPEGQAVEEKRAQYGDAYIQKLGDKMAQYWLANFADSMTYPEYVQKVGQMTNDFDPKKTASFLYPDKKERSKFLRDLEVSQSLQGTDIVGAFKKPDLFASILEPAETAKQKVAQSNVIDTIAKLVTDEGNLPTESNKKQIHADITAILDLDATPEEKKQLLFQKLQDKYGLGYDSIKELGLI